MWFAAIDVLKEKAIRFAKAAGIVLVIVGVIVALYYATRQSENDATDIAIDHETERMQRELEEAHARADALEGELFMLRDEVEALKGDINESVKLREELHDALDRASSIDDIDRILRRGIGR